MSNKGLGRRTFLILGGAAGLNVACGGMGGVTLPATIPAGTQASVAVGSLGVVDGLPVALGRDSAGIYALSLICTHAGCDMSQDGSVSSSAIECFCHGSVFNSNGAVTRGPARSALPHFLVTADAAGALTIHTDQAVPVSARLAAV